MPTDDSKQKKRFFTIPRWINLGLVAIYIFVVATSVLPPLFYPANTIDMGEDGYVSVIDNEEGYDNIKNPFIRTIYIWGDFNCHQKASRSFFINGNEMPFCARCTAIFIGMLVGGLIAFFKRFELDVRWILAGLVPMALDGGIQLITTYESTNLLRFLTGFPAGLITTLCLGGMIMEMEIIWTMFRNENKQEVVEPEPEPQKKRSKRSRA